MRSKNKVALAVELSIDIDSADPQNRSEWRGRIRERLVKKAQPSVDENGL